MKTVIIHLGDFKAGSTSLQTMFIAMQKTVEGVSYPAIGQLDRFRHLNLRYELVDHPQFDPSDGGWNEIADFVRRTDAATIFISDEGMLNARPDRLIAAVDQLLALPQVDVKLIAYIRPHFGRMISGYAQAAKSGATQHTFLEFAQDVVDRNAFCHGARLQRLRSAFGARFYVRLFHRDYLIDNDVCRDFLKVLDLSHLMAPAADSPKRNETPGLVAVALAQEIWRRSGLTDQSPDSRWMEERIVKSARLLCREWGFDDRRFEMPRIEQELADDLRRLFLADVDAMELSGEESERLRAACDVEMAKDVAGGRPLFASIDKSVRQRCEPLLQLSANAMKKIAAKRQA